ncbi:hypothetical protein ElyMa_000188900 [Elysia marginata]|uniref:Uncharacterized protein n=1 Tax=Elysia marginata TaxID=1093978 RepID=A0AAV4EW07_9GAST|nr:hypothetical protein ElyMa_000188900 [Elysia marginata]
MEVLCKTKPKFRDVCSFKNLSCSINRKLRFVQSGMPGMVSCRPCIHQIYHEAEAIASASRERRKALDSTWSGHDVTGAGCAVFILVCLIMWPDRGHGKVKAGVAQREGER